MIKPWLSIILLRQLMSNKPFNTKLVWLKRKQPTKQMQLQSLSMNKKWQATILLKQTMMLLLLNTMKIRKNTMLKKQTTTTS